MLASLAVVAQKKASSPQPFAKTITAADLKEKLYTVASADMQGRETATEGQRKAAAYIESYFKSLGLKPGNGDSYQQQYPVFTDVLQKAAISVNEQPFNINEDFSVISAFNHNATQYASEVVFVKLGKTPTDPFEGTDVKGKVILLNGANSGMRGLGGLLSSAAKAGAAAILQVQSSFPRKESTQGGMMYNSLYKKIQTPNIFVVSEKIATAIMGDDWATAKQNKLDSSKTYTVNLALDFSKTIEHKQSSNVLGVLEGTDKKDEYVFITGHYDHLGTHDGKIFFGADDDGSGTCAVLQLANAFAKAKAAGKGPRRTIIFMTVSGEEKGLWGSAWYTNHPIYPLAKTSVDLNIDMIGRRDPSRKTGDSANYIYIIGDDKLSSDLAPITEAVNKKYTKLELDRKFNDLNDPNRFYYRSDHYNFADKGVPIIFYFNGVHADYHAPTDTPDKINYDDYAKRARLVFFTAWEMANKEEMLKRDMPLK